MGDVEPNTTAVILKMQHTTSALAGDNHPVKIQTDCSGDTVAEVYIYFSKPLIERISVLCCVAILIVYCTSKVPLALLRCFFEDNSTERSHKLGAEGLCLEMFQESHVGRANFPLRASKCICYPSLKR